MKKDTIQEDLLRWISENRKHLPVRFKTAKVTVSQLGKQSKQEILLGKYNSTAQNVVEFYKPISKIINPSTLNEE